MAKTTLTFEISGRIDGRIRRLAAESELEYNETVRRLVSDERIAALERHHPPVLGQWGWGPAGWKRKVNVSIGIPAEHYERIRTMADATYASISDVARYLVTGGRTLAELDAEWRSTEPLEP